MGLRKLVVKPIGQTMRMQAVCSACGQKVVESSYESLSMYNLKKSRWTKNIKSCPHCKAIYKEFDAKKAVEWHKGQSDYSAESENGIFFVFKWGHAWRWSFKYHSEDGPRAGNTGVAYSLEVAKRICEKHKEWRA